MRIFKEPGISVLEPVEVLIIDDELKLPDSLGELPVFFFSVKDSSNTTHTYREGDSIVCFAKEEDAFKKNQEVGIISEGNWSAKLRFLVLECQQQKIKQLVIR